MAQYSKFVVHSLIDVLVELVEFWCISLEYTYEINKYNKN